MRRKMQQDCDKVYITRVGKLPILNYLPIVVPLHLTASMHDGKLTALWCIVDVKLVQLCWANLRDLRQHLAAVQGPALLAHHH